MLKLTVRRFRQGKYSTLSELLIDNTFICYGLEDKVRDTKIKGETAIPAGRYKLRLRKHGAMNSRYARYYPSFHQGMMQLMHVPEFEYIYLHKGNNIGHTSGCILVGNKYKVIEKDYELRKSAPAYKRIYKMLIQAVLNGTAEVEVINCIEKKKK